MKGLRLSISSGLVIWTLAGGMVEQPARAAVRTIRVVSGLTRPVLVTAPPGDTERLFIVEQFSGTTGRITLFKDGFVNDAPFFTVTGLATDNEQGLLGLAFHPDYANNRKFYVYYTLPGGGAGGQSIVEEYQASEENPDIADPNPLRTILVVPQPQTNHNAGWMSFGPNDGYLYIAFGDGGGGGDDDPGHTSGTGNGQDITDNLLGKILRIDINGDDFPADPLRNYAIPPTNPFVGVTGDDEIWAYGLRNPWRNSFDRATGDLYIADVGQREWEEINYQPASSTGGENYGWRCREATHPYNSSGNCGTSTLVDPVYEYGHSTNNGNAFSCGTPPTGCSVTGGYVYRGSIPELQGRYFFADYCSARIVSFRIVGGMATDCQDHTSQFAPGDGLSIGSITSFGEDGAGELYICDRGGEVFKIAADTDNDGIVDEQDQCPGTIPCASVDANGCPPSIPGDVDRDGDVDGDDIDAFVDCSSGPEVSAAAECMVLDIDGDMDVDQSDYGTVQRCLSGANACGDPSCGD